MTYLHRCALASLAIDVAEVERLHKLSRKMMRVESHHLQKACVSHERLRTELEGEQLMHAETRASAMVLRAYADRLAALLIRYRDATPVNYDEVTYALADYRAATLS